MSVRLVLQVGRRSHTADFEIVRHEAAGDDNRKNSETSTGYGTVWRLY